MPPNTPSNARPKLKQKFAPLGKHCIRPCIKNINIKNYIDMYGIILYDRGEGALKASPSDFFALTHLILELQGVPKNRKTF